MRVLTSILLWFCLLKGQFNGALSWEHGEKCKGLDFKQPAGPLTHDKYLEFREKLMQCEKSIAFGADEKLSDDELKFNEALMTAKIREYTNTMRNGKEFIPSKNLMNSMQKLPTNELFKIFSKMPKGALLHAYEGTIGTKEFFLNLTYDANVWVCWNPKTLKFYATYYSLRKPDPEHNCKWTLFTDLRKEKGKDTVDAIFLGQLSLASLQADATHVDARHLIYDSLYMIKNLILYRPNYANYIYHMLDVIHKDSIVYVEIRTAFLDLYNMDRKKIPDEVILQIYDETIRKFKREHPNFFDAKLIISPLRTVGQKLVNVLMQDYGDLRTKFPHLLMGVDLIGPETFGDTLKDYLESFFLLPVDVELFLQAGQVNLYGTALDENLFDAVLLQSRRISGAYAINKHPSVMSMVKQMNTALEITPIADQCTRLVEDLRNHPLATLLANDYPVVLSSDVPLFTGSTPLSHDFYATFMGIASINQDLHVVKKLIMNSFEHSALNDVEKKKAIHLWREQWQKFIQEANKTK